MNYETSDIYFLLAAATIGIVIGLCFGIALGASEVDYSENEHYSKLPLSDYESVIITDKRSDISYLVVGKGSGKFDITPLSEVTSTGKTK